MSTLLVPSPGHVQAVLPEDWPSGVVVATDGRPPSDAALRAAHKIAGEATFGVISVLPTTDSRDRANRWDEAPLTLDDHRDLIEAQVRRVLGDSADVWMDLRLGYPPAVLASYAETRSVSLLVTGIGRPRVLDRLLGDESTLRLARLMQTPLFAVAPHRLVPPRRIVVGMDFTPNGVRAARVALGVAAPDAVIELVHVRTPSGAIAPEGALRRHAEALQTGFCGRVVAVELEGDAATELLAFANARAADAIALGSHGHHAVQRGTIGPVATRVIRCSSCSLLLAPTA